MIESVEEYAIFMLDLDGHVATWNRGAERLKGYRAEDIVGRHFSAFYTADDAARGRPAAALAKARADGRCEDEGWRVRRDGTRFWANVTITYLRDGSGTPIGFGKITRDLSERRAAQEALHASEERFRLMVESVEDYAIFMLDTGGRIASWNAGAKRLKRYEAAAIIGRHFSVFYPAEDVAAGKPEEELRIAIRDGRVEDEGWRVRSDGTRFWASVVITALRDSDGTLRGFGKITRDLTERREYEADLAFPADHDPLSGLANRRSFQRELESHAKRVARYGAGGALLVLDLDGFKALNDARGHAAGDRMIGEIARALGAQLRESDTIARLGGDEFAVLLPWGGANGARVVADAILARVRELGAPSADEATRRGVTTSIGAALFDRRNPCPTSEILARADRAMYASKRAGGDCVTFHDAANPISEAVRPLR
jgi:diguanylate cyclase (GGDEF)-like protein/PAS domain S-box-containing protein